MVRGTTRDPATLVEIEASGIEAAEADPDLAATVLELIEGVTLIVWLLGSATGRPEDVAALHGPRLERVLEEIVDTPVRGFVYEAAGPVPGPVLERGAEVVANASERWRIPAEVVRPDPADHEAWRETMLAACERLIGPLGGE